ncbi:MAG: magnesium chelatase subunit H [Leptolyngbyaceae cyanobacterium MO_188.B28]|nr:magnesium chelatase subunit H [Leptolyngbyaceae cyanobacterium MO_188.B28]
MPRIVLIAGFESFNAGLYRQAAELAQSRCPELEIWVFSDRDLAAKPEVVETALEGSDVFFASLLFDYDQVMWLRERVQDIPIRLIFESALELMALTQLGKFVIGEKPKGMPKPVQFILSKFGSGKEEDKLAGYLSFLKVGPKLLKFIPARKVQDLRNWLVIYGYWNAGGSDNVSAMFWYLAEKYLGLTVGEIPEATETPNVGLLHPDYDGYFESPREYLEWYWGKQKTGDRNQNSEFKGVHPPIHPSTHPPIHPSTHPPSPVIGILLYRKHVITKQPYIPQLIRHFEEAGLVPLPIFINGVEGHVAVRDLMTTDYETEQRQRGIVETLSLSEEAVKVDAIVSTIGFPLVGGPAGSMEAGRQVAVAKRILSAKNVPYLVSAPLLIQDIHSWTRQGVGGLQSVVLYALPELDGAIDPVPLGGLVGDKIYLVPERVKRLTGRLQKWIALRQAPAAERKVAVILYGFPPGYGATGTAALLNVPKSLIKFLQALKDQGYTVGDLPEDGEALIDRVRQADEAYEGQLPDTFDLEQAGITNVDALTLEKWLGYLLTSRVEKQWNSLSSSGIKTLAIADRPEQTRFLLGGVQLGNVWIGVQPPLGLSGDPMRLMFERDLTPHPQYAAFYKWLQNDFQADAVVHFGMHGTVEWLPGSPLGNTGYSWSDILLGNLPHLYIYAANNPSESMLAKRRGYGVLISHNVPPYGRAGLYKELVALRDLIAEYREDPEKNALLKDAILKKIVDSGLDADCPLEEAQSLGIEFTSETAKMFSNEVFNRYLSTLYEYLQVLENRLFSSGLHVLGEAPDAEQLESYLTAYFGEELEAEAIAAISKQETGDRRQETGDKAEHKSPEAIAAELLNRYYRRETDESKIQTLKSKIAEALQICHLLSQTSDELTNLLRGLNGEYIPPAPGGDLLRDGPGVLPTGRNIHALDPYRMPSPAAYARGREIARKIIAQNLEEQGEYPETVAVMLWGLDAIKTRGESLGILLELVGAEPVKEGTGRIVRYELKPLTELDHPRIDILGNLSGIFRDSFVNIIELLDDLFLRAAEADEPEEQNFIRKHALALKAQGVENISARLFSNPSGDYGSLVNDRVVDSNWESGDELGNTWRDRNAFSYGRQDKGQARPEILDTLLKSTNRIVQQIDSVEYGLTDIQEYYANTGALKQAAEQKRGKRVIASFVESFSKDTNPRQLEDLLRMEYRTKFLNPKWAEAMADQGSGGAYEISQRMTALLGWSGTTNFADNWVYDQAADTYALDAEMAARLQKANPEAFRNIVGRMIEAHGRGIWQADQEKLEKLQELYDLTDAELEGVTV